MISSGLNESLTYTNVGSDAWRSLAMQYEQENMIYFSASISDFALLTIRSYDEASA